MKLKSTIVIFIILLGIWLILNNSVEQEILLSGIGISLFLSLILCRHCAIFNDIRLSPKTFVYTIIYLFVFSFELLKANIDIARRVLTPSLPINPGIVKAQTVLKSKMARIILANSITLTPGTLTIDLIDDTLYIHCVHIEGTDTEKYAQDIVKKFEKYLEVLYG